MNAKKQYARAYQNKHIILVILLLAVAIFFAIKIMGQQDRIVTCTREYAPVCANGKTYSNACLAKNAGENTHTEGACVDVSRDNLTASGETASNSFNGVACTREYEPVCGDDGKTYPNACVAGAQKVTIIAHQSCEEYKNPNTQTDWTVSDTIAKTPTEEWKIETTTPEVKNEPETITPIMIEDTKKKEQKKPLVIPADNEPIQPPKAPEEPDIEGFPSPKYKVYKNGPFGYKFALPRYTYYRGYGPRDGANTTLAIGTSADGIASFENAQAQLHFYKVEPANPPAGRVLHLPDNSKIYITGSDLDNPKIQNIIETIIHSVQ